MAIATPDDVRAVARRRRFDDATFRLALELAERGTVWAAHDQGEVVAIATAAASDEERHVGDLFVEPSYRGQGIGGRLLGAAFAESADAGRSIILDPNDAAGTALAFRYGCASRGALLRVAGAIPREEELAKMAAGNYRFEVAPLDAVAHEFALRALDREARGTTRMGDHAYFTRFASGQVFFLNGECAAYAYVWPDGRIGPVACVSPAYLVQIFGYTLVTLQRNHQASWCTLLVPGANVRIARAALRAGLRIEETLLLASDSAAADGSIYVGYHPMLY